MSRHRLHLIATTLLTAVALCTGQAVHAQADSYPGKAIKIVVPFTAGGVVDSIARVVAEKMAARYGQAVVVENRPGASGAIGTDFVAKSAPDGHTLLLASFGHAVVPSLNKGVTWDPVRDFRAVLAFGVVPNAIVVHPDVPAKTLAEFIELARQSALPLTYATPGVGTSNQLAGELLTQSAGIRLTHVTYKGQPDALNDLFAGRVNMMPMSVALASTHAKAGKVRALAVTTATRSSAMPQLPTVAEAANLPHYEVGSWFGLMAPSKVPAAIIQKLNKDLSEILSLPDVKTRLNTLGLESNTKDAAEFDAFVAKEVDKWRQVVKKGGLEAQ